jgi:hypothetical protein
MKKLALEGRPFMNSMAFSISMPDMSMKRDWEWQLNEGRFPFPPILRLDFNTFSPLT